MRLMPSPTFLCPSPSNNQPIKHTHTRADEDRASGALFPPIEAIRDVSAHVAAAVAHRAYNAGVATELPRPHDLLERAYSWMYNPHYRRYR